MCIPCLCSLYKPYHETLDLMVLIPLIVLKRGRPLFRHFNIQLKLPPVETVNKFTPKLLKFFGKRQLIDENIVGLLIANVHFSIKNPYKVHILDG